jgi:hypothetical protein
MDVHRTRPSRAPPERQKTPETQAFRGVIREASFKGELSDSVMMHEASSGVKMKLTLHAKFESQAMDLEGEFLAA